MHPGDALIESGLPWEKRVRVFGEGEQAPLMLHWLWLARAESGKMRNQSAPAHGSLAEKHVVSNRGIPAFCFFIFQFEVAILGKQTASGLVDFLFL